MIKECALSRNVTVLDTLADLLHLLLPTQTELLLLLFVIQTEPDICYLTSRLTSLLTTETEFVT